MMPFKKNLPAAGSGFSDYYVPEEKFLGPPSPKNLATPLVTVIGISGEDTKLTYTDPDPNTGKYRHGPFFRYSSEFRYSSCDLQTTL